MSDFERALNITLAFEGGNVDDPRDPGGRTSRGVTQRVFDAYSAAHGHNARDVYAMSQAELEEIYRAQYWQPIAAGRPWPLNAVLFDCAVNSGVGQALRWLESAKTRVSVADPKRMENLARDVLKQRRGFFQWLADNRNMGWALKGWLRRLDQLKAKTDLL